MLFIIIIISCYLISVCSLLKRIHVAEGARAIGAVAVRAEALRASRRRVRRANTARRYATPKLIKLFTINIITPHLRQL
jgi:hypothetical protein